MGLTSLLPTGTPRSLTPRTTRTGATLALQKRLAQCFDDMREGLAELRKDSWILQTAVVEYLEERRRKNLNRLGDWAREREESSEGGSECNYDWA